METQKPSKEEFARQFILTGCRNGSKAAVAAGYSEKTAPQAASRLLKDVNVIKMITEFKKASLRQWIWTKEEKLIKLEDIATKAMEPDPERGMVNMSAAIAAIEKHNIMQGDNAPSELDHKPIPINVTIGVKDCSVQKEQIEDVENG